MDLLSFLFIIIPIVLCPGPMTLAIASISSTYGFGRALFSIFGGSIAYFIQVVIVSLGVSTVLVKFPVSIEIIKVTGMFYIFYLAWRAGNKSMIVNETIKVENIAPLKLMQQGIIVGITNPKSLIIFSAIFPNFLTSYSYVSYELCQLTIIFLVVQFLSALLYALMSKKLFSWFANYSYKRININSVGLVFAGLLLGLT